MKVLILGANGMLGHKLYQVLSQDDRLDVYGTVRNIFTAQTRFGFYNQERITLLDSFNTKELEAVIANVYPDIIINCIGIVDKQYAEKNRYQTTWINSIFPYLIDIVKNQARLIHISTDCVFSGREGNYTEGWPADATDVYGKTKYLGEVTGDNVLTIRTSIIGRELVRSRGLLEWFISNRGSTVDGYSDAIFSGFPTVTFAGVIKDIILNYPELNGLYHIASNPIDKYHLLYMINKKLSLGIKIIDLPAFRYDRSLDATKFNKATGFKPRTWGIMLDEMAKDAEQYSEWR